MNIIQILKSDHREIKILCNEILKAKAHAKRIRQKLFRHLGELLNAHVKPEEQVVYEQLKEVPELKSRILEMFEEHHVVDLLLTELLALPIDDEHWIAKLAILRETLLNHIEIEENEVFPEMRRYLSQEEMRRMADAFFAKRGRGGTNISHWGFSKNLKQTQWYHL